MAHDVVCLLVKSAADGAKAPVVAAAATRKRAAETEKFREKRIVNRYYVDDITKCFL